MKQIIIAFSALILLAACNSPEQKTTPSESFFPLKAYVETADDAFRYEIIETVRGESWTEYRVHMVSGTWLTSEEVDETEWWHWLTMVVPDEIRETESLMHIGGGSRSDTIPGAANKEMINAALTTGSVVSYLHNVPFQPIDFTGDNVDGVFEDDLIAFAWLQFMQGGATEDLQHWLPRFPMSRAVVRAMDVVQEICESKHQEVDGFFVTGASKRGWTTWTVAAVDERVVGIASVVIDMLNLIPSFQHHWQCYGEWAPAIDPYVNLGIMDWMEEDEFLAMLKLVEPYQFLDRLTMPKLLINATCDEFFVTDSWKYYWNDLQGENYLQYVPNVGHGLHGSYLPENLLSFYQRTITESEIPNFKWCIRHDTIYAEVEAGIDYQIRIWEAVNPEGRDFKSYVVGEEAWQMTALDLSENGSYALPITAPERGYKGALVEVVFNPDSDFPLTLTTGTVITPDSYPFAPFASDLSAK
ncbi:MAG: PhoPQ-activated pathogenicity-like protein PqaA type [Bacteroidales bacterium]|nr:PhoPQ-activated pathogenicity-like protein PqaA type [Bacteroidales bacterium]